MKNILFVSGVNDISLPLSIKNTYSNIRYNNIGNIISIIIKNTNMKHYIFWFNGNIAIRCYHTNNEYKKYEYGYTMQ